jgi:hypothetical protein
MPLLPMWLCILIDKKIDFVDFWASFVCTITLTSRNSKLYKNQHNDHHVRWLCMTMRAVALRYYPRTPFECTFRTSSIETSRAAKKTPRVGSAAPGSDPLPGPRLHRLAIELLHQGGEAHRGADGDDPSSRRLRAGSRLPGTGAGPGPTDIVNRDPWRGATGPKCIGSAASAFICD